MSITFTVFFDGQFWVGVLTRREAGWVRAARTVFGAEPGDAELHAWLLANGSALLERAERAPRVRAGRAEEPRRISPKRAQRLAAREAAAPTASTAARLAVKAEQEARSAAASRTARKNRDTEREEQRARKRAKARARHRGH